MFAGAHESYRCVGGSDGGNGAAACGVTVGFGDDDGAVVGGFFEGLGLRFGLLADGGVEDHDCLVGFNGVLNLCHFVKEVFFLSVSTRGVDDDDFETLFFEFGDAFGGDEGGVGGGEGAEVGDFCFGGILFQLVEGAGAEGVGANEAGFEAAGLVMPCEFCAGGCFAGALEAHEHYDI